MITETELSNDALLELLTLTVETDCDGVAYFSNADGELHRLHGPAVIYSHGRKEWWGNGEWIRTVWIDGSDGWVR